MARNLREKLPSTDTVRIFDINKASLNRFVEETKNMPPGGAVVEISETSAEASADSVRRSTVLFSIPYHDDQLFYL
jgi:3-hydroxyisobutyrate dehydrogenase